MTTSCPPGAPLPFFKLLDEATEADRRKLFAVPFVHAATEGDLDLSEYVCFLGRAYHHVRHTVPLLMATGAALAEREPWLLEAVCEYIKEEKGHEEWILDDISACGADAASVRHGEPDLSCELLVAWVHDAIARRNPLSMFGMVHVLEGTSVRAATSAAEALQARLGLPPSAFTYLTSHGQLDREHVSFFEQLMNRITNPGDQRDIVHAARACFQLYGNVLDSIPLSGRSAAVSSIGVSPS